MPSESSAAPQRPNFPAMEEAMLEFWEKKEIFTRSIEERPETKSFVFYDGPPFATGLPHYGHLLQSTIKDAIPRYFTMQGYRVQRRWGWDCHGLPVENLIEKSLKLNSKRDIESYGIDKFNDACRSSVMEYTGDWKKYVRRIGRWVDFDGAYKTMDASYIESVWSVLADLWNKKFIYKDLRVSLFCPRCSTPLSNFEIAMGNHYIDAQDPAVMVKFPVKGEEKTYFLSWTTTPWTLPANVALAVHPDEMYVRALIHATGETLIFADGLTSSVLQQFFPLTDEETPFEVVKKMKGEELMGMSYEPLYPMTDEQRAKYTAREGKVMYQVIGMEYVTIADGTGIVHTAPAFGEEDFSASKVHDLPVIVTVDDEGRQKQDLSIAAGMPVKESDPVVREDLRTRGLLYRDETVTHSIPICWRCATKLLYKAQPAWFVNVTKLKPKMLETAKKISWNPEHFKEGRFGKGLETAPDWCISRTRFWGAPLPVWACSSCDEIRVISSIADLEQASGKPMEGSRTKLDLHRPGIDLVTMPCKCGGEMKRILDVFDCWFESGSMPYASEHYPFERKASFEEHFPADFIAEGQDQTRGWFYGMHVLATAMFGKPAFKQCNVTGMIMAEDGKKMSKSLKNYPDPWELLNRIGADALRLYFLSSPVVEAEQLNFSEKDVETIQRTVFGTLWNVRAFYKMYAGEGHVDFVKPKSAHVLDRWLMARMATLTRDVTTAMEAYDLVGATRPLRLWVDDLSTWWLRRSRERMKGENEYEKLDALRTLREALLQTALVFAPFAPFFSEQLYQDMGGPKMSVHLDKWPKFDERVIDEQLLKDMVWARSVTTAGHEARAATKMPVRQALASVTVRMRDAAEAARLGQRTDILAMIRDELNVEKVILQGGIEMGTEVLMVELDTQLTPELKRKGMMRELSRQVMNLRKQIGLQPHDMISVSMAVEDHGLRDTIESMKTVLMHETHAEQWNVGVDVSEEGEAKGDITLDGMKLQITVSRIAQPLS